MQNAVFSYIARPNSAGLSVELLQVRCNTLSNGGKLHLIFELCLITAKSAPVLNEMKQNKGMEKPNNVMPTLHSYYDFIYKSAYDRANLSIYKRYIPLEKLSLPYNKNIERIKLVSSVYPL